MRHPSLFKCALFLLALLANLHYLWYLYTPGNVTPGWFAFLTLLADSIAVFLFLCLWGNALYFELFQGAYHQQRTLLQEQGKPLLSERVAILIPMVNESLEVVENTIKHALRVRGKRHVYLLDDGKKEEHRLLAERLGVTYVKREGNAFYKAGNLNHALKTQVFEPYFVVVDADFILHPDFLQKTLPYFADPTIGAVQTPQVYSNEENFFEKGGKHLQDIFYRSTQPARHLTGSAFCVGTGVIFRRQAIVDCQGFAEVRHSEDVFTTIKVLQKGYVLAFHDEELTRGLSPSTLIALYRQQHRWARGGLKMLLHDSTLFKKGLTLEQRLQFFASNFFYLSSIAGAIYFLSPLLAILWNTTPFAGGFSLSWAESYLPFFGLNTVLSFALTRRYRFQAMIVGIFCCIPYLSALRAILFSIKQFEWKVTNTASKGFITFLLAPALMYLTVAGVLLFFLFSGTILYNPALLWYYVWGSLDCCLFLTLVITGYHCRDTKHLPSFSEIDQKITEHVPVVKKMLDYVNKK